MADAKPLDAIALLKADHRKVEELFEQFEKASGDGRKRKLAEEICMELTIHAAIEEEIFYPACMGKVDEKDLNEAYVEHDGAKVLIAAGDTFVLCSDGLWGEVGTHEILAVARGLGTAPIATPVAAADALVGMAIEREAADNVTAVVVHVSSGLPIPSAPAKRRSPFRRARG